MSAARLAISLAALLLASPALAASKGSNRALGVGEGGTGATSVAGVLATLGIGKPAVYPDFMPGGDMGAKIVAAIATLPASGGKVDASGLIGVQYLSTPVIVPKGVELVIGSATIWQSATVTLAGDGASISCQKSGFGIGFAVGPSYFRQSPGANLQNMLLINGGQNVASACVFDGNNGGPQNWQGVNNPNAGPLVAVNVGHFLLDKMTIQNGALDGAMIYSGTAQTDALYAYGSTQKACCGVIRDTVSINNGRDGFNCGGSADVTFEGSRTENNGRMGVNLNSCATWRFTGYDIGGNRKGIWVHGGPWSEGVSANAGTAIIGVGNFGNNLEQDVLIDNSNSGLTGSQIVGAQFWGSSGRPGNTYAAIDIKENGVGNNLIAGITVNSPSSNPLKSAIYIHGEATGHDTIGPVVAYGSYGGAVFDVPSTTALVSACYNGSCTTSGQTQINAVSVGNGSSYASKTRTAGLAASDQYAASLSNPSNDAFAAVEEDIFAGKDNNAFQMAARVCQRDNLTNSATCARYVADTGTKQIVAVEGGHTPVITGCNVVTNSARGQNTVGEFSLYGACSSPITLQFWTAAANGWKCQLNNQTSGQTWTQTGSTTATATFTGTGANNDVMTYGPCFPY